MSHLQAVQNSLVQHLQQHVPTAYNRIYATSQSPVPLGQGHINNNGCIWLQGPHWQYNSTQDQGLDDIFVTEGFHYWRYAHCPTWDLTFSVLLLHRNARDLQQMARQLCVCMAHKSELMVPVASEVDDVEHKDAMEEAHEEKQPAQGVKQSVKHSKPKQVRYGLAWKSPLLQQHTMGESDWLSLSGQLQIEGVMLEHETVLEEGTIAQNEPRISGI